MKRSRYESIRASLCGLAAVMIFGMPAQAATIFVNSNITTSETWTADNEYVLGQVIYVTNGATLTIEPGTVIRGEGESSPGANDPGTLVIARGAKIHACGTKLKPIVFTDLFDDNVGNNPGSFPYDNLTDAQGLTEQWGGVIVLGRTYVANNTLAGPNAAREVQIEGLTALGGLGFYGNGGNDDDDSGTLCYVSIRYGGFNLSADNEINGLTLGAVGRSTDIHHVEVYQNKDDGIEFFAGTVNVKYAIVANVGDDGLDYDEGYRGKVQFAFVMQGTPGADKSDKGGEFDGGNNPDGSQPFAIPTVYNATFVGLGGQKAYTDSLRNTTMHIRDNAGGRFYNSLFADFGGAPVCIEGGSVSATAALTSGERAITPYTIDGSFFLGPASDFQLELRDNCFWCMGNGGGVPTGDATAFGCDSGKVHYDNGLFSNGALGNAYFACGSALPIRGLTRGVAPANLPDPIISIDPRPAVGSCAATSPRTPPNDGFFVPASYKGAFAPDSNGNWARGWSTMDRLGYFPAKPQVLINADITTSQTWTADNDYVLGQVIYVTNGATVTIEPGTVIRGEQESSPGANDPGTLVITRGSKINAQGTEWMPIVFTDLNDDNVGNQQGSFPYDSAENAQSLTEQWGGVIVLGRTYVANNTLAGPNAAREVQIEGLTALGGLGFYGNGGNDDDDSGVMKYVSIRYGGFNLSADNEINGLTLGAVGRETDLDYVEVFQNKDDGIEFFAGTVNLKRAVVVAAGDDGLDYDEGYRGYVQFALVIQGTPGSDKSDKGGEFDGGNNPDGSQPFAIPTMYNTTYIGLGAQKAYTDSTRNTGLHIRDNAGGRFYNSFFADFGGAPLCIEGGSASGTAALTSGERSITPYVIDGTFFRGPASDTQLEFKNNTFWCFGNGGGVPTGDATAFGCDSGKVHHDPGIFTNVALGNQSLSCATPLPIRTLDRGVAPANLPDPIVAFDPRPSVGSPLRTTDRRPPLGGFFEAAPYRGAFSPGSNWAGSWTNTARLGYFPQCSASYPDAVPNETQGLVFYKGKSNLRWTPTVQTGLMGAQVYDLLRKTGTSSADAADFSTAACVETDDTDSEAFDTTAPAAGQIFFYLVRAQNDCGPGTLGFTSAGVERIGSSCP